MKSRVIPILRSNDEKLLHEMSQVIVDAGFSTLELTLMHDCVWSVVEAYKNKIEIAVGTVLTSTQLKLAYKHNIQTLFSPGLNAELVQEAKLQGMNFIPGVLTPTEIQTAIHLGCTTMKIFPIAPMGGASYLKTIQSVYPSFSWVVSGGIQLDGVENYLSLPQTKVGVGQNLFDPQLLAEKKYKELSQSISKIARL